MQSMNDRVLNRRSLLQEKTRCQESDTGFKPENYLLAVELCSHESCRDILFPISFGQ